MRDGEGETGGTWTFPFPLEARLGRLPPAVSHLGPDSDCQPMSKDHFRFRILKPRDCHFKKRFSNGREG